MRPPDAGGGDAVLPDSAPASVPATVPGTVPAPVPAAALSAAVTGGLAVLLVGAYLMLQSLLMVLGALLSEPLDSAALSELPARLHAHAGWLFSWATLLAAPPTCALAAYLVWRGARWRPPEEARAVLRRHLGLAWPPLVQLLPWGAATAALLAVYELAARWLERPPLPDFMVEFHATAGSVALLGVAVVVAAPLAEEVLFRGFLLPGLAAGRPGPAVAVVLSALLWAAIHAQYDVFDVSAVFLLGLVFGAARLSSRSLLLPFLLHVGVNLVALKQLLDALG